MSDALPSARPGVEVEAGRVADRALADLSVDGVAVAQVSGRASTPLLTRGPLGRDLERLHFDLGEGPGSDAAAAAVPVVVTDLRSDLRWPAFATSATALGLLAVWAQPLTVAGVGDEPIGWIGVARVAPGHLTHHERLALRVVGPILGHLALRRALVGPSPEGHGRRREIVHIATGVLAARDGIDVDGAAWRLRARAWLERRPLADVATEVVTLARSGRA